MLTRVLTALALATAAPGAAAQHAADERATQIDQLVRAYTDLDQFAGVVLVADGDRVIHHGAVGLADRELGVPLAADHRFVIGSITKSFTAVLVLQEVAASRIVLDSPVVRYWTDFPDPSGGLVTVRHLLAHRSGLGHWNTVDDFLDRQALHSVAADSIVRLYAVGGLRFPPGTDDAYSSPGYMALGVLLEQVTGERYADLLRRRIFDPLGMDTSTLDAPAVILPGRVAAYRYNFVAARYDNAEFRHPFTTGATGGIVSTAADLLRWAQALETDSLLPDTLRALLADSAEGEAAYGWRTRDQNGVGRVLWHDGLVTGYRSLLVRVPERRWTIVLLGNLRDAATGDLADGILAILAGGQADPPRRSLMKEILRVSAAEGSEAATRRFDQIVADDTDAFDTSPTQLLIAAIELRSDNACDRAAPLYEHWLAVYEDSPYRELAARHLADCRVRLEPREAAPHP